MTVHQSCFENNKNKILSAVISSSVPSHVGLNSDQSYYDHLEFISSDFSCTSSVTSSRSGMGKWARKLDSFVYDVDWLANMRFEDFVAF